MAGALLLSVAATLLACAAEEERPPTYKLPPRPTPLSCGEIRGGSAQAGQIMVNGAPAPCVGDGLECPMPAGFDSDGACDPDEGVSASCAAYVWRISCYDLAPVDASTTDAADGGPDAESPDAP